MPLRRRARTAVKRLSFTTFLLLDRFGIHVLPKHYYTPVADRTWLRENQAVWQHPASLAHIHWDLDEQLSWLEATVAAYYGEVEGLSRYAALASQAFGPGFGAIESQVLHCFIRAAAPARVVEVGGGMSTAVIVEAARMNAAQGRRPTKVMTIDPFAGAALESLADVEIISEPAQTVSPAVFEQLEAGDLLFMDTTHVVKTGSEVLRLYLEVLPSVPPGIIVHAHDIYLPYLYSQQVLTTYFDWQETSLVLALLTGNEHLRVLCCLSALHWDRRDSLRRILRDYRPQPGSNGLSDERTDGDFPSSLWLETA